MVNLIATVEIAINNLINLVKLQMLLYYAFK